MPTLTIDRRLAALPPGTIDLHTHAIDPALIDVNAPGESTFPTVRRQSGDRAELLIGGRCYRQLDKRSWSIPARLRDMDAEGVAAQVLSPVPITLSHDGPAAAAGRLAQAQNDFLASLVAQQPTRFFALGAVPLQDPAAAITELVRCMEQLHFVGVEIGSRVGAWELANPELLPFFQAAAALSAVVFVHPVDRMLDPRLAALGIGFGLGMPAETALAGAGMLIGGTLDAAAGLRLCLAHGGGALPAVLPRLARGEQLAGVPEQDRRASSGARRLWSDSLTYDAASLALAANRFGSDHIVLGTDYPFTAREAPAGAVLAELPAGLREPLGRGNALAMFSRAGAAQPIASGAPR